METVAALTRPTHVLDFHQGFNPEIRGVEPTLQGAVGVEAQDAIGRRPEPA